MEISKIDIAAVSPHAPTFQYHDGKPAFSYGEQSSCGNRLVGASDFRDPLFDQQPLRLQYNQSVLSTAGLGHASGDRLQPINSMKPSPLRDNQLQSRRKSTSRKDKLTHRQSQNGRTRRNRIAERKGKTSVCLKKGLKSTSKQMNRSNIHQSRHQVKYAALHNLETKAFR